jgi:GxxExxY protein
MNTDDHGLRHAGVTSKIIGVFFEVYNELGTGFLESVYVEALAIALCDVGLSVERELPLAVSFRGKIVGRFRADLVVGGAVLIETKACPKLNPVHEAQLLNYLRATVLEVGLLLNFGSRPQFRRLLFDNGRKTRHKNISSVKRQGAFQRQGAIRNYLCSSVAPLSFSLAPPDPSS